MVNKKKKVLIVIHHLTFGGVQKSLIPALNAIDYDNNEVTLYVRKKRLQLLNEVNAKVSRIIINEDSTHYYRKAYMILLQGCKYICDGLKLNQTSEKLQAKMDVYLNRKQMEYEQKTYFSAGEEYDVAVSYIQGYTSKFVAEYIHAKKKIVFFHASTDDNHKLHRDVFPKFNKIVAVNNNVQDMLKKSYPCLSDKIMYLDNYVDAEMVRSKAKEQIIMRDNTDNVICSCGRLAKEKGYDMAVEAARCLKARGYSFVWYFIGDGPMRTMLEDKIAAYDLENNITITGMLDNPYPYMHMSDIYVQPSYEESFGLTIAEAKILNKPVVSTKTIGGVYHILNNENGILVDISSDAISEGITRCIDDTSLRGKIENNLRTIDYIRVKEQYEKKWNLLLKD